MKETFRVVYESAARGGRRSQRWALTSLTAVSCLLTLGGVASAEGSWLSGTNGDPIIDRASVEAFANWRGKPADVAMVYTDRGSWDSMTRGSSWMFDNFAGFPGKLVISTGLVPNGRPQDLAACAAGAHDDDFRDFAKLMVDKGRGDSILRLGWEFNGDYLSWAGVNTQQWIDCYRHAAAAVRSINPDVTLDWTINSHGTPANICGGSSINCYPGDDVVDIIGTDNYDMGPSAESREAFERIANAPDGLNWLYDFAVAHGKRFSVGEWGVAPGSRWNATGDNDGFVRWMHEWFSAHADNLVYEAYFNHCSADVGSNLYRDVPGCPRAVKSAEAYRTLFGANAQ